MWKIRFGPGIQKIYEVVPLTWPKCSGRLGVVRVIEEEEVVKKILKHPGPWKIRERPAPKVTGRARQSKCHTDYAASQ
jgi:hypothetical protein